MKVRDIVTIFEKPITEERSEGQARLIKKISNPGIANDYPLELWKVEFIDNSHRAVRLIKRRQESLTPEEYKELHFTPEDNIEARK